MLATCERPLSPSLNTWACERRSGSKVDLSLAEKAAAGSNGSGLDSRSAELGAWNLSSATMMPESRR
jgi:hypothetical protein